MPRVAANGLQLYYEERGSGTPIVFLSGIGGDHRAFILPMRQFGPQFWTIGIDNRDVGQSERAKVPYTTADMADDLAGLFDALDVPPAHVVGHSLGGMIAQEFALRHPARVRLAGARARPTTAPTSGGGPCSLPGSCSPAHGDRRVHAREPALAGGPAVLPQRGAGGRADPLCRAQCLAARSPGVCPPSRGGGRARYPRPPGAHRGADARARRRARSDQPARGGPRAGRGAASSPLRGPARCGPSAPRRGPSGVPPGDRTIPEFIG